MRRGLVAALLVCAACAPVRDLAPSQLAGYRVVYRIGDRAPGQPVTTGTESVEVLRPYDARVEERSGGRVLSGRVTSRRHFWQLGSGGKLRFGVLRPPGSASRDTSLTALRDAARAGTAIEHGADTVLGHRCTWFAYRDPAPQPLAKPDASSRIESCVDSGGVVLREVWTLRGRPARVVDAISYAPAPPPPGEFLEGRDPQTTLVSEPKGAELIGTVVIAKDVDRKHAFSPFAIDVPSGWREDRITVVGSTPGQGAQPTQYLARSFVRGADLVVVEASSAPHLPPPWPVSVGKRVRIGEGEARVVYYTDRVEIRLLSELGYARVVAPSMRIALEFVRGLSAR